MFSLGQSIKYNYEHLTKKFYNEQIRDTTIKSKVNLKNFNNKKINSKYSYWKISLISILIIFTCSLITLLIPFTRCAIFTIFFYLLDSKLYTCDGVVLSEDLIHRYMLFGSILSNLWMLFETLVLLTLMLLVFRYPINEDKFYFKREFILISLTWYLSHQVVSGIYLIFEIQNSYLAYFLIHSSRNLIIGLINFVITLQRRKITDEEILDILKDFNKFMYCHVCFTFFKNYLYLKHEEETNLLVFWIECNIFKKQFSAGSWFGVRELALPDFMIEN